MKTMYVSKCRCCLALFSCVVLVTGKTLPEENNDEPRLDRGFFVSQIFEKYGTDEVMTYEVINILIAFTFSAVSLGLFVIL